MDADRDPVRVALSSDLSDTSSGPIPDQGRPFRILVMGDFSCREDEPDLAEPPTGGRRPVPVASPDELMADLAPVLTLELEGPGRVRVPLTELADFHPDRLVRALPHLQELVASIDRAVEEQEASAPGASGTAETLPADRPDPPEGLLDEIVAEAPRVETSSRPRGMADLKAWIRRVVDPHLVRRDAGPGAGLRQALEREAAARVVELLHARRFRDAEALWRGLLFFMSRVVDPDVRVHALDLTRAELEAGLGTSDVSESSLVRTLLGPLPGPGDGVPALLVAVWPFGGEPSDIAVLNRLAIVAHALGAPLIAAAKPQLLGLSAFADAPSAARWPQPPPAWEAFRGTEAAESVGLAAPRFLLRLPYGEASDRCDVLPVDEVAASDDPWLWGSPAFPVAVSVARAFVEQGRGLTVGPRVLTGLPFHVARGGAVAHPVEAVWPGDVLEGVAERGVMPLGGYRHEARLRVPAIFSARSPRTGLAAWWGPP